MESKIIIQKPDEDTSYNLRGSKGPLSFQKAPSGQNPDRFSKAQKAPSDFFFAFYTKNLYKTITRCVEP